MPVPGLATTYDFVDWLKRDDVKYKIPDGQQVIITGVGGGLVTISIHKSYEGPGICAGIEQERDRLP